MEAQMPLNFDVSHPSSILTLNGMVYDILAKSGDWWMPFEICNAICNRYNVMVSDSSCTARLRDLRKLRFGSHAVEKRRRVGSTAYEYRLSR